MESAAAQRAYNGRKKVLTGVDSRSGHPRDDFSQGAMVLRNVKVGRRLGMFFLIISLLALVEWVSAISAITEALITVVPGAPYILHLLYLALSFFRHGYPPLIGLIGLVCPGNGFAAYCAPLSLLVMAVTGAAVVAALLVNFSRKRQLDREGPDGGATQGKLEANLAAYGSLALTVVLAASFVFLVSGASFLGTGIHSVVAQVDSPVFILN